ncbi:tetratricopeptide repeat protein [Proteiniphilum acetatigenes]|uniref:tetratricopeptide repeat protein n=1 Tax=Proteiniphilum acetatigenes TaxID=294710 RepID=UPI0012F91F5D|nr:tetratricopeptide repeat protein [Proteiniphilum acetatigenes]
MFIFSLFLVCLVICNSCRNKADERMYQWLSYWDSMVDSVPQLVSDSLQRVDPEDLGRSNRAYYGLLKVISDDKTYVNFTSDSLINSVTEHYRLHDPKNRNYIRALSYQGIVRTRMGVRDSTVYEPLREAGKLFASMANPDPSLGYMINYFLGNIHYNNRNYTSADEYFRQTLRYAREERDSIHLFDTYLALYWNEMEQEKFDRGKLYLDTLSGFYNRLPGKDYFILNAQSIYYDVNGEPERALEREKTKLLLFRNQEENIELSRVYYNISYRYVGLEQLDSAMLYAQMAIDCIEDPSFMQNYLYYHNVANIAEKQGDFALSNKYLRDAFELYNQSISDRLDTRIVELEKKYDLSEAENEALRARQQSLRVIIGALILVIILIFILMYSWKIRRTAKLKLLNAEYKMQQQELQARILREEAGKRKWLLQLYSHISGRLAFLQGEIETLTQRYISSHPKVYREMETILKNTDTDLRDITKTLAMDDETFYSYTRLRDEEGIFNATEKMLLMLLACDADNRQLATFMNTSLESVRVRKSQLKKKMQEKNMDTSLFNE